MLTLYKMLERPRGEYVNRGAIRCSPSEAVIANRDGYGIFQTINDFGDGPRRKDALKAIRAWAVDIDGGNKDEQRERIQASPLIPSEINETKAGFHLWFFAEPGASVEGWIEIVKNRMIPFFGADPNAADVCRILRVPGFWHLKDPASPFLIRTVHVQRVSYTEAQMLDAFPETRSTEYDQQKRHSESRREYNTTDQFWEAIYNLDCAEGLIALSGSPLCGGEQFTLRRTGRGNLNLFVDKKSTSVWIDGNKRIGSFDKGGPTLYQWLRWYGVTPRDCVAELKRIFPHLDAIDKRGAL